jgi:hypothetical protein
VQWVDGTKVVNTTNLTNMVIKWISQEKPLDRLKPNQISPIVGSTGTNPQVTLPPLVFWRNICGRTKALFQPASFLSP